MERKKHKRKTNHVIIVTSDAVDASVKQFRIKPWTLRLLIALLCILLGGMIGYFCYEGQIWQRNNAKNKVLQQEQQDTIAKLEEEKKVLEEEKKDLEQQKNELKAESEQQIATLNEKIVLLSETVNQKVQSENELTAQLEKQHMPTEVPLTGSASIQEITEGNPICIFTASKGAMVVAAASGTILTVTDDPEYGHCLTIDHGNGYMTVYRNQGEASVKEGDSIIQGMTLFIIGEDNTTLGYQMMKDGAYINPMDVLVING